MFCFLSKIVVLPTGHVYADTATLMIAVPTDLQSAAVRCGIYTASPVHFDQATGSRKRFINAKYYQAVDKRWGRLIRRFVVHEGGFADWRVFIRRDGDDGKRA